MPFQPNTGSPSPEGFLRRAVALARHGLGLASPNPLVGAIVVSDGRVVGEGWHEGPGTLHAEMSALRAAGEAALGATLYVTLEPCSHHGRTPPCAPAVARAGIAEVVVGAVDPNPVVDGRGLRMLRDAGVRVTHADGSVAKEAAELVSSFAKHIRTGLPLVTLKLAASLDGKVAARDGSSKWITGEPARQDVHRLRAGSDAIVVGAGTALADGPSLTVRLEGYRGRQPLRVLVDGSGRVPATRSLFDSSAPTLVATTRAAPPAVREAWESAGAEVVVVDDAAPKVALARLFEALGKRNLQCVLLEGGPSLAWSALEEDVVDRFVLYVAPKLIGGGEAPSVLGGAGVGTIAEAVPLRIRSVERIGEDLKVVADVHRNH